ncbi:hypothetical protein H0H81_007399 [Sphagnurus paluster]|uniref:Zinc transporter 6 n=1 Tax=Sphagnurus paluster TaxID=117069 RepID=A0A9P7GRE0_9AGAR|nr:hypothetical protein H0H81_007399 [Sphagnurus paluster]
MDGRLHRRKASRDEDENMVLVARPMEAEPPSDEAPLSLAPPPMPRTRVHSTPSQPIHHGRSVSSVGLPPSAGPFKTGFNLPRPLNGLANNGYPPASPFRSSFAPPSPNHSRTRSISAFSPSIHSPLASSFPPSISSVSAPTLHPFPGPPPVPIQTSYSAPDATNTNTGAAKPSRRHARLHSRNLSVFFPRPGTLPPAAIAEDGAQELVITGEGDIEAPVSTIPSAGSSISLPGAHPITPLGAGFTFGGRPPPGALSPELLTGARAQTPTSARRGHHHKHSMSHSFFSFLEPGATGNGNGTPPAEELHTQPTPMPLSPWANTTSFPQSAKSASGAFPPHTPTSPTNGNGHDHDHDHDHHHNHNHHHHHKHVESPRIPVETRKLARSAAVFQFVLGAYLWVTGQQVGSLSVTGIGYWVVFDAFGIGLACVLPSWLEGKLESGSGSERRKIRRPYGNTPIQTVFMFAQAVYLMFSAVYVCKETVEHLLLSAGGGEGHHHHHGDEDPSLVGIEFPIYFACLTLFTLAASAIMYDNHTKLRSVTGARVPSVRSILRALLSSPASSSRSKFHQPEPEPTTSLARILVNPFTVAPLAFTLGVLGLALLVPASQHRTCDLILAAAIAAVTFHLAYNACTVLGVVLLQTAPPRGASGRMEAFLRVMREIERHPQVVHLPAPHIWQLGASPASPTSTSSTFGGKPATAAVSPLVVTLELHVRQDLGDDDVLALTRWAWEMCAGALGGRDGRAEGRAVEVTVGVVRG